MKVSIARGTSALALVTLICALGCDAQRGEQGEIVEAGQLNAFNIREGDCFNDSMAPGEETEVTGFRGLPCTEKHDNETFAVFDADFTKWPGQDEIIAYAHENCIARFESFVGMGFEESTLDITVLYPTAQSWRLQNDREVICAVTTMSGEPMVGSMKNAAI